MAEFIAVASGKGGVGKTAITANLGAALAKLGRKTLLIDMDAGLRNLDIALGLENEIVYDMLDVFEGRCEINDCILKHGTCKNLYFMPAPQTRSDKAVTAERMQELKTQLSSSYDYVIMDSPAGVGKGFLNSLAAADMCIIAAMPDTISLRDADRVASIAEEYGIDKIKLIINRLRLDLIENGYMMNIDDCLDLLGVELLGVIPDDDTVTECYLRGKFVLDMRPSKAGEALSNIAKRLTGENVPLIELSEHKKTIFGKLGRIFARNKRKS